MPEPTTFSYIDSPRGGLWSPGIRILSYIAVYVFCLVALFPKAIPQGFAADSLFVILALFLCGYTLFNWKKIDIIDFIFILIGAIIIGVTLLKGNLSAGIIVSSLINSLFAVFVRGELRTSNYIIRILYRLTAVVIVLTFISMFFPVTGSDGGDWYFIGGKNALAIALVPAALLIIIYSYLTRGALSIKSKVLIGLSIISILIGGSSTGAASAILLLLIIFFKPKSSFSRALIIAYPVLQVILYNAHFLASQPLVADIVTGIFGKSLTFTERTDVWTTAIEAIQKSFIFGYGRNNGIITAEFPNLSEAHNLSLELLLTGGVLVCVPVVILITTSLLTTVKTSLASSVKGYALYIFFIVLVIGLMESVVTQASFWLVIALCLSVTSIERSANGRYLNNKIQL